MIKSLGLVIIAVFAVSGCTPQTAPTSFACKNYSSQPEAQKAWQSAGKPRKNDPDGDGVVCTSLRASKSSAKGGTAKTNNCLRSDKPRIALLNRGKYPETSLHIEYSWLVKQPTVYIIDRAGADKRRDEWHKVISKGWDTNGDGQTEDMDEIPMAMSKNGGYNANIALLSASDNRGAGSSIASQLRKYCDGQLFKIKMYGARPGPTKILVVADKGHRMKQWVTEDSLRP
jgi:hypothetical protein